jgi:hypothetical protein
MFFGRYLLLFALGLPSILHAGDIYGTLREGSAPRAGVQFQVFDGSGNTSVTGRLQTQSDGSFRFNLSDNGRYLLRVFLNGSPSANIFVSSPNPTQYDFDLVRQKDGTYTLVRR